MPAERGTGCDAGTKLNTLARSCRARHPDVKMHRCIALTETAVEVIGNKGENQYESCPIFKYQV